MLKETSSKKKHFQNEVWTFFHPPLVMREQVQKSHLFTRKILFDFLTAICVILHDSLQFLQFFRLYPKKCLLEEFRLWKAQMQRITNKILASNENAQLSNAERNATLANRFAFLLFLFSNCEQRSKKSFQFWNSVHTRLNSKRLQRNFQKKGRHVT